MRLPVWMGSLKKDFSCFLSHSTGAFEHTGGLWLFSFPTDELGTVVGFLDNLGRAGQGFNLDSIPIEGGDIERSLEVRHILVDGEE